MALEKDALVCNIGIFGRGTLGGGLGGWRRNLFQWEEELLVHMSDILQGVRLVTNGFDSWAWKRDFLVYIQLNLHIIY